MEKQVELYTQPGCNPCIAAAEFLEAARVPFTQYDVTEDSEALDRVLNKFGSQTTPTIVVDGQVLIGFDPDKLTALLQGDSDS